jgi:hypothetical protein
MRQSLYAIKRYSEHTTTILFVVGFFFDMFLLPDISDPIARYIGCAYLVAIALLIMFREWTVSLNRASQFEQKMYSFATFVISYCSGSALSFVFVYSLRSAALSVSWPLFLILSICIIANEFVSTHNFRFTLDVGVLLIAVLFYTVFNLPILLKTQSDTTFGLSVAITTAISLLYVFLMRYTSEMAEDEAPRLYALAVGIPMFVGMLYFLNIIPAVPLSLKENGVYHEIMRTSGGEFLAKQEVDARTFSKYRTKVFHFTPTDSRVYFFSAIDAPADLTAPLSHVWEKYDNSTKRWVQSGDPIPFALAGGRADGYRAFSYKENVSDGLWRVTVYVGRRVVGRSSFYILKQTDPVPIKEVSL